MMTLKDEVSHGGGRCTPSFMHVVEGSNDFSRGCEDSHAGFVAPSSPEFDSQPKGTDDHRRSLKDRKHEPVSQGQNTLSYAKWCSTLVPEVLRTRTPFGAFLAKSIRLSKCLSSDLAPTFFPLPIPPGYWHEMPAAASSQKRRAIHRSRALHVIVMALNFWHSGGSFPEDHLLQRAPNSLHLTLFRRIRALLRSDGPASAFQITKAGRRFPELVTRLGEISEVLTKNGCSVSPYEKSFVGVEVPKDDSSMPELQPYRDLNPDRLVLFGKGGFDATGYLSDPLVMPYREPAVLAFDNAVGVHVPIRDSQETIAQLAALWDKQGLLMIHREAVDPSRYVRIFNAFKSSEIDRQIGDRRSANALEARISEYGPSCRLPAGSDFSELSINPKKETLVICITDRKDFYHQFWTSRRKALANTVGPGIPCHLVDQCNSYALFSLVSSRRRYNREKHGDMLHGAQTGVGLDPHLCHIAFRSILQGDPATTDVLHLCLVGGWASVMGFRRPTYSLFNKAYTLVDTAKYNPNRPRIIELSRAVANELVLAAVLHPLMMTDIGCKYHPFVFATDASSKRGAICSCQVEPTTAEVLWKTSKSKGSYTRLLSPSEELLRRLGIQEESCLEDPIEDIKASPSRPLAYRFDFIEVFAGAAKVTAAIQRLGIPTGPPIELSFSEEFNVEECHVVSWLTYLLSHRLILGIMVEPPCTTFSIIRRPALRSRDAPYGHNPAEEKTRTGNVLGCRACQLMKVAGVNRVAGLLETTYSSMLKHLLAWHSVQNMACSKTVRVDSCRFGSPHLKSFRMLCVHLTPDQIDRRCVCASKHLQVQGKYTKGSATYTDKLADAIALDFAAWIFAERRVLREDAEVPSKGLESLAINDVAISGKWTVDCAWNFRKDSHINILEESSLLRLAQRCANLKYPTRITAMVDSNVVRGASSKGRSSSLGLSTVLRRFNAVCVAAALYFSIPFCPTRHNPSDDPTRDTPLRCTLPGLGFLQMDRGSQFDMCSLPKLKRWTSNWARLILRLAGCHLLHLSRRDLFRRSFVSNWFAQSKIFDSTLGFPGEGPLIPGLLWIFLMWIYSILLPSNLVCLCLLWP